MEEDEQKRRTGEPDILEIQERESKDDTTDGWLRFGKSDMQTRWWEQVTCTVQLIHLVNGQLDTRSWRSVDVFS